MYFYSRKFSWCVVILVIHITTTVSEQEIITIENGSSIDVVDSENNAQETEIPFENATLIFDKTYLTTETENNEEVKTNTTVSEEPSSNFTKVNCLLDKEYGPVELVNATRLVNMILESGSTVKGKNAKEGKQIPGPCILIMFYAGWCIFSSQAAPHFNALPRFFPNIQIVAIDAMKHQNFNTQYGIVGVPTLMLVHNGKPVAKFNDTVYTLETFSKFIIQLTTLQPNGSLYVTSADFSGPVSSTPSTETDYYLVLSWIFIAACVLYFTSQSQWWRQFVELVQNTWRESNAQHEHVD